MIEEWTWNDKNDMKWQKNETFIPNPSLIVQSKSGFGFYFLGVGCFCSLLFDLVSYHSGM